MAAATPRAQPPVVRGHPFVAEFRCSTRSSSEDETVGRMFRDGQGRKTVDYMIGNEEIRVIDDITTRTLVILDLKQRLVQREDYGTPLDGWSFRGTATPQYTQDRREFHGVECRRVAFRMSQLGASDSGDFGETWIAESQGLVMKDEDPSEGWMWEVTAIELREPDHSVFVIPTDFVEVE